MWLGQRTASRLGHRCECGRRRRRSNARRPRAAPCGGVAGAATERVVCPWREARWQRGGRGLLGGGRHLGRGTGVYGRRRGIELARRWCHRRRAVIRARRGCICRWRAVVWGTLIEAGGGRIGRLSIRRRVVRCGRRCVRRLLRLRRRLGRRLRHRLRLRFIVRLWYRRLGVCRCAGIEVIVGRRRRHGPWWRARHGSRSRRLRLDRLRHRSLCGLFNRRPPAADVSVGTWRSAARGGHLPLPWCRRGDRSGVGLEQVTAFHTTSEEVELQCCELAVRQEKRALCVCVVRHTALNSVSKSLKRFSFS